MNGEDERDTGHPPRPADETLEDRTPVDDRDHTTSPVERRARSAGSRVGSAVKEVVVVAAMALVLSFVVKTWLVQAFYIPSDSMMDTLIEHDRVVVSKLTPGVVDLNRGDVVVFADPDHWLSEQPPADRGRIGNAVRDGLIFIGLLPDTSEGHLIKRVIGLPGDHVACCDAQGRLTVNGTPITEPYVKAGQQPSDTDFDVTVPQGRIWVMGDNRGNSSDSRFHDPGSVPVDLVVGRAVAIVWPLDRMSTLSNYADTFARVPPPATARRDGGAGTSPGAGADDSAGTASAAAAAARPTAAAAARPTAAAAARPTAAAAARPTAAAAARPTAAAAAQGTG